MAWRGVVPAPPFPLPSHTDGVFVWPPAPVEASAAERETSYEPIGPYCSRGCYPNEADLAAMRLELDLKRPR